ncbi:hypothetical protein PPSIR1_27723 [Plesiocystis pacifica SIR-1]|uniref:Carboxypeptidase regulatory-like domain-containing protein n=2 Tax=Plesiocystis pacifica TaxID=191768 RepID=A6GEH3_9BACT|nr:hypothetical protein PPSIR1_27723 [Plesiocystis pacifica SIR-1]
MEPSPGGDPDARGSEVAGRHCRHCARHVNDLTSLDDEGLGAFLDEADASPERRCVRVVGEVLRTVNRGAALALTLGVAGVVAGSATGCASPSPGVRDPGGDAAIELSQTLDPDAEGGMIGGFVRDPDGEVVENAIIVLQQAGDFEARERMTNARGIYRFDGLPPGTYTVQALHGRANVSKVVTLPEDVDARVNFVLDGDRDVIVGMVIQRSQTIDTTTASSTYVITMD